MKSKSIENGKLVRYPNGTVMRVAHEIKMIRMGGDAAVYVDDCRRLLETLKGIINANDAHNGL